MHHITPVYTHQSDTGGGPFPLPMHRDPTAITSEAGGGAKGSRSWFAPTPRTVKSHLVGMLSEFVGTTLFLFLALGGAQVASTTVISAPSGEARSGAVDSVAAVASTSNLLYIAFSFGLSLSVCVFIFAPLSGGLLNPAVSLGLWVSGTMRPLRAFLLSIVQFAGGIAASALVYGLLPGGYDVRTTLAANCSIVRGVFIEVFLTAMLMLTILLLAVEKNEASSVAALGIGLALFCAELVGVVYTGGSLNPARSLGPAIVSGKFSPYCWIYFIGPGAGAALAAGLFRLFKYLDYKGCLELHVYPASSSESTAVNVSQEHLSNLPFPSPTSPSQRPSIVSFEKAEPRDLRMLRTVTSATTLMPDKLDRIEIMLAQLLAAK